MRKDHYLEDQKIIEKEFGKAEPAVNGVQCTYTWTNRQNEWYNAERRFIFSCKSEQERTKWMSAIKVAAKNQKNQMREEAR